MSAVFFALIDFLSTSQLSSSLATLVLIILPSLALHEIIYCLFLNFGVSGEAADFFRLL